MKEISEFDDNEINSLIIQFLKNEKIPNFIKKIINLKIDNMKKEINNIHHLNIILVGPTGVGKSTLINAILGLEKSDSKCEIGFGTPQTKSLKYYESKDFPFLRLVDSQGIEKNPKAGIFEIYDKIKNFIKEQIDARDYDKFIHCIWYCWTGSRLEECEIKVLQDLSKQYSLEELPVIIVYTKAINNDEIEKAKKYISELGLNNTFIETLAKEASINFDNEVKTKKPYNLDKLRNISIESAKNAIKSSVFQSLMEDIMIDLKIKINDLMIQLKENNKKQMKDWLEKLDKISDKEEDNFYELNVEIILNVFYQYFLLNTSVDIIHKDKEKIEIKLDEKLNFSFGKSNINIIKNFVINYFNKCLNSFKNNMDEIMKENTNIIIKEINIFRNEFIAKNEYLLENDLTNIEHEAVIKNELKKNLYDIAKLTLLKNAFNYIISPLAEKIGDYFIALYSEGIKNKSSIQYINDIIKISFDDIEQKIKEYNLKEKNEDPAPQNKIYQTPSNIVQSVLKMYNDDDI